MVSVEIVAALITVVGGGVISGVGYLIRQVRKWRQEMKNEHGVVVQWLANITDAMREEGMNVDKPDELEATIEVDD